ncbi:MAG: zinc ribbon domain-containing protein [Nitrososphaerota archaeon]
MRLTVLVLAALLLALALAPARSELVEVSNRYGLPFAVDGRLTESPVRVPAGSTVCVVHQIYYLTPERRLVFTGWSDGETAPCIRAKEPIQALYREEVLIVIDSIVEELRGSMWVAKGERVALSASREYVRDGYRYVFLRWSRGERPFDPTNYIVATDPAVIEAQFKVEVRLDVVSSVGVRANGSGWYRPGETAVVSAPREVVISPREKLVFREWVSVGSNPQVIFNPTGSVAILEVRRPAAVRAEYDRYYFVSVRGPEGVVLEGWYKEGELLQVSVPAVIEVDPGRIRLVFEGWRGDLRGSTPSVKVPVTGPLEAEAVYRVEYRLEVRSPVGATGSGWYRPNSTAVVNAPREVQAALFLKRVLSHYAGDCGEGCTVNSPLRVLMDSPKYVEVVYRTEPDPMSMGVVGGAAAALSLAYYFSRPSRRSPPEPEEDVTFCHACGAKNRRESRYCTECGSPLRHAVEQKGEV